MTNNKNRPWFGIMLIVFGIVLLLNQLNIIDVKSSQVLWAALAVFGFAIAYQGFSKKRNGKIFWGTVLFLTSILFILRNLYLFDSYQFDFGSGHFILFPAWILIFGFAFLMVFINNPKEYVHLVLSLVLISIGGSAILVEAGYLYEWDVWNVFHRYWPVVLIAIGFSLIFRKRRINQ
jgi:hypothetical protein